jgi:LysR family hydrogen peroxide-inducible transcriptional activator
MPYRPTLRQLEYIVALDDLRHFGKAAKRCHVSQPTLSVQIGLVESNLEVTLFERTPTSVIPTAAGARLVKSARVVLTMIVDLLEDVSRDAKSLGGIIRLGTAPTFGPYFLSRFLPGIHAVYPQLQIYIREDRPAAIDASVAEGVLDCGLGPSPTLPGLRFRKIGDEKIFLGVPVEHPLAVQASVKIGSLRGEKLLALGSGHRLLENVRHLADSSGAQVVEDFEGTSLDSIRQMVSIGMGLSLFPELYARAEFRNADDVKLLTIEDWAERREVGFYWRDNSGRRHHYETLAKHADGVSRLLGLIPTAR